LVVGLGNAAVDVAIRRIDRKAENESRSSATAEHDNARAIDCTHREGRGRCARRIRRDLPIDFNIAATFTGFPYALALWAGVETWAGAIRAATQALAQSRTGDLTAWCPGDVELGLEQWACHDHSPQEPGSPAVD
jgi:hypothetical protein